MRHDASAAVHMKPTFPDCTLHKFLLCKALKAFSTVVAIHADAESFASGFEPSNAAHGGRRAKEDIMFRYTRGDLAQKSNAQLSALFNLATVRLAVTTEPEADTAEADALLALIRDELQRRFEP